MAVRSETPFQPSADEHRDFVGRMDSGPKTSWADAAASLPLRQLLLDGAIFKSPDSP